MGQYILGICNTEPSMVIDCATIILRQWSPLTVGVRVGILPEVRVEGKAGIDLALSGNTLNVMATSCKLEVDLPTGRMNILPTYLRY